VYVGACALTSASVRRAVPVGVRVTERMPGAGAAAAGSPLAAATGGALPAGPPGARPLSGPAPEALPAGACGPPRPAAPARPSAWAGAAAAWLARAGSGRGWRCARLSTCAGARNAA